MEKMARSWNLLVFVKLDIFLFSQTSDMHVRKKTPQ
jgi:hypothetical protein